MATCRIFLQNLFTLWEKSIKYYKVLSREAWIHILFSEMSYQDNNVQLLHGIS